MDRNGAVKFPIPKEEFIHPGHFACPGCSIVLAMRYVLKGLGGRTIMVIPPSCSGPISGGFPVSALKVPVLRAAFETTAVSASGMRVALDSMGKTDINVLAWGGDGATYDIGLQCLSAAAERNDNIIYVCYDNEAYMNTGIQRSSATPEGAWTTTTPGGKKNSRKDIIGIMAAHKIPYIATASIAYPVDLIKKVKKAKNTPGTKFLLIFAPCPTGWRFPPNKTIKIAKLATQTNYFPLYEIENGEKYRVKQMGSSKKPVEYFSQQGRFRGMDEETLRRLEEKIEKEWEQLTRKAN